MANLGIFYRRGMYGLERDDKRGFQLLNRAVELGSPLASSFLMNDYEEGRNGCEKSMTKFVHCAELAAYTKVKIRLLM